MQSNKFRVLVLGLGNPALGDDGVGWNIAQEVKKQLSAGLPVDVNCLSLGGISLMEHLIGYSHAILIDAFALEEPIGSILILKLSDLPNYSAFHTTSIRDTSLKAAIEMGKSLGAQLPDDVSVVGIATKRASEFSKSFSPPVAVAIPQAVKFVMDLLNEKIRAYEKISHLHG
jgi:hydrogenase maturation protease